MVFTIPYLFGDSMEEKLIVSKSNWATELGIAIMFCCFIVCIFISMAVCVGSPDIIDAIIYKLTDGYYKIK